MKADRTNWQRFFDGQMRDVKFRGLVGDELRVLRIGAQIAALRELKKLTRTQLAARARMSAPNISRKENGPSQGLTIGHLARIARAMGYEVQIRFQPTRGRATRGITGAARPA